MRRWESKPRPNVKIALLTTHELILIDSIKFNLFGRSIYRDLSPAGIIGGKTPLRLAAPKSRPRAPLAPMFGTSAHFLRKWGV